MHVGYAEDDHYTEHNEMSWKKANTGTWLLNSINQNKSENNGQFGNQTKQ